MFCLDLSRNNRTKPTHNVRSVSVSILFDVYVLCAQEMQFNAKPVKCAIKIWKQNEERNKKKMNEETDWWTRILHTTRCEKQWSWKNTHTLGFFQLWILRNFWIFYFRCQRCCCLYDHRWTAGQRERNASISTENDLFMFFPTPIVLCFHGMPSTSHAYIMIYVQIRGMHETCYRRRVACSAPHTQRTRWVECVCMLLLAARSHRNGAEYSSRCNKSFVLFLSRLRSPVTPYEFTFVWLLLPFHGASQWFGVAKNGVSFDFCCLPLLEIPMRQDAANCEM